MGQTFGVILSGAGIGYAANASLRAGSAAKKAGDVNSAALVDEAEYNARVAEYNAQVSDLQAKDALQRGQLAESAQRTATSQRVGNLRASYAAQGVNLDVGSPRDVVRDVARGGALDAATVRFNAAREAWGFGVQAQNDRATAGAIRTKGSIDAYNAKAQGDAASATGKNQAIGTILTGGGDLINRRYGFRKVK